MDRFLPASRLHETEHWVAFHHPQPEYPLHILILPKHSISSLSTAPLDTPDIHTQLIETAQALVCQYQLEERGFRLICNGGPNQTIPQWHWHLISDQGETPQPGEPHA